MQHLCHMAATRVRCYLRLVPGSLEYAGMLAGKETGKTMSNGGGARTVIREKREAARGVLGSAPDVPLAALENREFLKRAVLFLTREKNISQFVDIGPGLPT